MDSIKIRSGFFVAKNSRSDYDFTPYCMASYLNGSELQLSTYRPQNELYTQPFHNTFDLIAQSRVAEYLEKLGYKTVNFSLFKLKNTEFFYNLWHNSDKEPIVERFFAPTLWKIAWAKIGFLLNSEQYIAQAYPNKMIMDTLGKLNFAEAKQPLFVYAHVMMPHAPFCFDENGQKVRIEHKAADEVLYLGQLRYTNILALQMLKAILNNEKKNAKKNAEKPIIILQGDHGFPLPP